MKILSFIAFVSISLLVACTNDPAAKLSNIELSQENNAQSKKKIAEQYSSPDNPKIIKESEIAEDKSPALEYKNESEQKAEKLGAQKEEKPKAKSTKTVAKAEAPTFVKKVTKAAKPIAKRSAEIEFDEYSYEFGEIMQGDKIEHKFTFTNTGNAPLSITKADATCGCATPSIPFMDILPGEQGYIGIMYNSVGKEGEEFPQVTISSNASEHPNIVLKLKGYVKTPEEVKAEVAVKDSMIYEAKDSTKTENIKEEN